MPNQVTRDAVGRLAAMAHGRTEADLQTDTSIVLLSGGLNLKADDIVKREVQVGDGTRRRIDVQLGHLVIEVKRDLSVAAVLADAEAQLAGYVRTLTELHGSRYAGVLTDGRTWRLYGLAAERLRHVTTLRLTGDPGDADRLVAWLDAVLATREGIKPTLAEITARLGASSPSHQLAHVSLTEVYDAAAEMPEVELKRRLWAKLLRTAFGEAFMDDRNLFVNHTLLVLTAEAIAHAVLGFDLRHKVTPRAMARGDLFADAQVYGVVEADFFDWVLDVPGGPEFVTTVAHRVAQFDWGTVEHDVLKVLYESVIDTGVRQSLGEFYTPDWLADRIVAEVVTQPLTQRVLDPACGSGTFLFHAVRAYLTASEAAGQSPSAAVAAVTGHVVGIDIHPVAVTFSRVTYLLALGRDRLTAHDRGPLTVPVYLGDSLQWEQHQDLLTSGGTIVVATTGSDLVEGGGGALFGDDLIFPASLLADAHTFDRLVARFAGAAIDTSSSSDAKLVNPILNSLGIHEADRAQLRATFATMRRLHREGRDHIWAYYVRNLVRPLWLSEREQHVDVLVGNPPWLRYSKMTPAMQERYKALAKPRGLLKGGLGASARDLSTLFVARCVELYLKDGGRFGFVMPHGVMSRKPHEGFRTGNWSSRLIDLRVCFATCWDLEKVTTGFPITSCVIFGTAGSKACAMPAEVKAWSGRLGRPDQSWANVQDFVQVTDSTVAALSSGDGHASPYASRFRQGAIIVPRILLRVDVQATSLNPLGAGAGRVQVRSHCSPLAKEPWKFIEPLSGTVERRFVQPMLLGETVAPFRLLEPARAVLPIRTERIMSEAEIAEMEGLSAWWAQVERVWEDNRRATETAPLLQRMDFHGQLSAQLPAVDQRVVYTKSGSTLFATRVTDPAAVIDHKLYWAAVSSPAEAQYLTAVLNSETLLKRVRPLQGRGLFGPRDFDKHVFRIPIPTFVRENDLHEQIAELARTAEATAAGVDVAGLSCATARRAIITALSSADLTAQLEEVVDRLLPVV